MIGLSFEEILNLTTIDPSNEEAVLSYHAYKYAKEMIVEPDSHFDAVEALYYDFLSGASFVLENKDKFSNY